MKSVDEKYLLPTDIVDSDHVEVITYAQENAGPNIKDHVSTAINLYYAVRDGFRYNPYSPFWISEYYRASSTLKRKNGMCTTKSVLLCAVARACGIPSRLGYANVKNHLTTKQFINLTGSGIFMYHSFTEFYLDGSWVKASPAFDKMICKRHNVVPLDFNGREDSLYHLYNTKQELFMEYLKFHESRSDVPVDEIVNAFEEEYGKDRVQAWKKEWKTFQGLLRNFNKEDVTDEIITV